MQKFKSFLIEARRPKPTYTMYHSSASGDLRGGTSGLHLGTHEAAKQALHARIGHPAEGSWDGKREYGKTKLAGQKTMREKGMSVTGHNCGAPEHDYFPHEHKGGLPTHSGGERINPSHRPAIKKYEIHGPMSNTPGTHMSDAHANGVMKGMLKRGKAKRGYFYKNIGEDDGSISAVVPNGSHVREIE